jgi:peptide/nickel transport system permease protein
MGPGVTTIVVVITLAEIPVFGRLVRTSLLTIRALPYVESSRVMGAGAWWLMRRHMLPNALEPLIIQLGISMSIAVFIEGALSFLGLGIRPPAPSLGSLIRDGIRNVWQSPTFVIGPLVVVTMLVLGFLLISQALAQGRRR